MVLFALFSKFIGVPGRGLATVLEVVGAGEDGAIAVSYHGRDCWAAELMPLLGSARLIRLADDDPASLAAVVAVEEERLDALAVEYARQLIPCADFSPLT